MEEAAAPTNQQSSTSKNAQVEALSALLEGAGLEPADLLTALTALAESKKATAVAPDKGKSIYQEKELVYEDESATEIDERERRVIRQTSIEKVERAGMC